MTLKMRLAGYLPWLRDEQWHNKQLAKLVALHPSLGATERTLVETHHADPGHTAKIWAYKLADRSTIYKVGIVVQVERPDDAEDWGPYGAKPEDVTGRMGARAYASLGEARENLPGELARARRIAENTFTTTDKHGETRTWVPYLFADDKPDPLAK